MKGAALPLVIINDCTHIPPVLPAVHRRSFQQRRSDRDCATVSQNCYNSLGALNVITKSIFRPWAVSLLTLYYCEMIFKMESDTPLIVETLKQSLAHLDEFFGIISKPQILCGVWTCLFLACTQYCLLHSLVYHSIRRFFDLSCLLETVLEQGSEDSDVVFHNGPCDSASL
jgi:hypothetical protein